MSNTAADYPEIKLYIDGQWTDAAGGRGDDVVNPATEEVLGRVPFAEPSDVDAAIAAARAAFPKWRDAGPDFRSGILLKAAALLHQRADEIGRVMTLEEGKPLAEAVGEVHRAATGLQWNTEEGRRAYGRIIPSGPDEILSVRTVPVGPVGAFVPWNFPAGGPMRKISAALAAGCSIVIKPSEEVPGTVSLIARAFEDAGLPAGVLNVLFGVPDEISRTMIPDPAIRFIAFTGSVPVGKHLAGLAAAAMKPAHMELGGHAPVIVCADTDPVKAAKTAVRAKIVNAGQVCTSPSRFMVDRRVYDAFTEAFTEAMAAIKVGNGLEPGVQMGPMVSHRRLASVQKLVGGRGQCRRDRRHRREADRGQGLLLPADRPDRRARQRGDPARGAVRPGRADRRLQRPGRGDRGGKLTALRARCLRVHRLGRDRGEADRGVRGGHPVHQPLQRLGTAGPLGRFQGQRVWPGGRSGGA